MKYNLFRVSALHSVLLFFAVIISCKTQRPVTSHINANGNDDTAIIKLADPAIFMHNGVYYLYGTGGKVNHGFMVYTSTDLKSWKGPAGASDGYALVQGESYGSRGFWAPQVFYRDGKFYMAYTANENIAIAESNSPLGPFKQAVIRAVSGEGKQIDPYVFFDDNGKRYLYHVRLNQGNRLYVAELNDDISDIKPGTLQFCLAATDQPWENTANTQWPVSEGPTVLKHNGLYYLFYSTNDFRNIDYAVGYAVSASPLGPWKKYEGNPVISRHTIGINGTGHGDFFKDKKGNWRYVFHTHKNDSLVSPRITAMVNGRFARDKTGKDNFIFERKSFRYFYSAK